MPMALISLGIFSLSTYLQFLQAIAIPRPNWWVSQNFANNIHSYICHNFKFIATINITKFKGQERFIQQSICGKQTWLLFEHDHTSLKYFKGVASFDS
jgi:hypothetical protein